VCSFCEASASHESASIPLADVHCAMCGYLCVGCARRHAKVPYTRAHPVVSASSASVKGGVRFCPLHAGKVLRGVCTETECQKALICEDCLNFGDHHDGHKPQLLVEYEASIADEMAERVEALHNQAEQTAEEMHEVEAVISSIRENTPRWLQPWRRSD
jgi:hypothetical protein